MIKLVNVNKQFKNNERVILNSINLELPDKGLVIFLGRSGSGKSTLLNVIGGLDNYQGSIDYGEGASNYKMAEIDKYRQVHFSYIFQDFYLEDNETVFLNVKKGLLLKGISDPKECEKRINESLKAVGLLRYRRRKAGQLSLGQRQRVAVARAISSKPNVLFADEPTGNLDSANGEQIFQILKELSNDMLVLLVTHNEKMASKYNDILYRIEDGILKEKTVNNNSLKSSTNTINTVKKTAEHVDLSSNGFKFKIYNLDDTNNKEIEIKILRKEGKTYIELPSDAINTKLEPSMLEVKEDEKEETNLNSHIFDTSDFDDTKKGKVKEYLFFPRLNSWFKRRKFLNFTSIVLACVFSFFFVFAYNRYSDYSSIWNQDDVYLCSKNYDTETDVLEFLDNNPGTFMPSGKYFTFYYEDFSAFDYDFNGSSYSYLDSGQLIGVKDTFLVENKNYKDDEVIITDDFLTSLKSQTTREIIGSEFIVNEYGKEKVFKIVDSTSLVSGPAILFPHEKNIFGTFKYESKENDSIEFSIDIFDGLKFVKSGVDNENAISLGYLKKNPTSFGKLNNNGFYFTSILDSDESVMYCSDYSLNEFLSKFSYNLFIPRNANNFDYQYKNIINGNNSIGNKPSFAFREDIYEILKDDLGHYPFEVTKAYPYSEDAPAILGLYDEWTYEQTSEVMNYSSMAKNTQYFYINNVSYRGSIVVVKNSNDLSSYKINESSILGTYKELAGSKDQLNFYLLIFAITLLLFTVMILTYSLLFRSYNISQEKRIGVYRSLGMNRAPIYKHMALEITTTFGLYFAIPYVFWIIVFSFVGIPVWLNTLLLLLIYGLVLLFSMLPVFSLLSKTPHNIMVKHDI